MVDFRLPDLSAHNRNRNSNKTLHSRHASPLPKKGSSPRLLDPSLLFETSNIKDLARFGVRRNQSSMR